MNFLIPNFYDIIDIFLISVFIYKFIQFIVKTTNYHLILVFLLFFILDFSSTFLKLEMLQIILRSIKNNWFIFLIILFQAEIKNFLNQISKSNPFFLKKRGKDKFFIFLKAVDMLSEKKRGALIVFEKNISLNMYVENGGEVINAIISEKLIFAIFNKKTILHDGAIIIKQNMIHAVKVVLPLSDNQKYINSLGTRHLAGLGISEKSDAIAIIVSEETGNISLAKNGNLIKNLSVEELSQRLNNEIKI